MSVPPTDPNVPPVVPPVDPPAPVDPPVTPPSPVTPPVITFPATDLTKASWWQWALTTVVSLAIGIATLLGHPFDSALVTALVPSAALVAASIATAVQVHGVQAQKVALINYQSQLHQAQLFSRNG